MLEGPNSGKFSTNQNRQVSYWLNVFLTESKSILKETVNIIKKIDADIKVADIIKLVFCFPIFVSPFEICSNPPTIWHFFHSSANYLSGQY